MIVRGIRPETGRIALTITVGEPFHALLDIMYIIGVTGGGA
jgi:hypothetical protein